MSFENALLGNLRGNGVLYVICVIALVGAFKVLGDYPKQKKFVILGTSLLMAASILGGVLSAVLYDAIVGSGLGPNMDHQKHMENIKLYSTLSSLLQFVTGAAHAAGVGFILYAVFVGKFTVSPKRSRRGSRRDEDDDDDRPRRSRRRDEDEDDEDDRPRRRSRRN